ncbi:ABC transporter ATP-binding protein [Oribacterium sp. oral taxon 078]|uniref:ABC transporter ATP-binding protein n=1 Tax=Oribacterium sp. oral taxon 078 TaxID=652706 RepID=UPI0004111573|nr:ABC transporter ATP-binding protein [Oribacterium sp. oral taxon 078]
MRNKRINIIFELLKHSKGMRLYMLVNCIICFVYELLPIANIFLVSYMTGALLSGMDIKYASAAAVLVISVLVHSVFGYLNMWTEHDIAYRLLYKMRYEIYHRLEQAIPSFSNQMMSSEMVSIASSDMNLIEWFYAHTINIFVVSIVLCAVLIGVFAFLHPFFAFNAFIWIVLYLCSPLFFNKKSKEQGKVIRERYGRVANVILDAIQGMREILSFNMWESYRRKINARIADYEKGRRADAGRRACGLIYAIFISTMMTVSTLCISYHLYRSGSLAKQWILAVITVGGSIFAILGKFVNISTQFSSVFAASERVLNLLNLPITVQDTGTVEFNEAVDTIEFENVSFKYPNSRDFQIKNMSFKIHSGKIIALSGESGSGKSTIVNLLQRYADPSEGKILINGKDIRSFTLESWRRAISVVTQDAYLFKGTVMENIKMGQPGASDKDARNAAVLAQAHDFITQLPNGYGSEIGERALKISEGQKQRLSIARAILKNSSLMILDEAQSSLDSENEGNLNKAIKNLSNNKFIISIAHRISSIRAADMVLFIDKGSFIAFDSYDHLSENCDLFIQKVLGREEGRAS